MLGVVHEMFYWHGIRATDVDRVAAEAGVAPTTLYRLFASKDDLIAAYIERASGLYREWFDAAVAAGGTDPRAAILAVFGALGEQVQPQNRERLGQLTATLADDGRAGLLADQLSLVMEGTYASAQALTADGPARHARTVAESLLDVSR